MLSKAEITLRRAKSASGGKKLVFYVAAVFAFGVFSGFASVKAAGLGAAVKSPEKEAVKTEAKKEEKKEAEEARRRLNS